MSGDSSEPVWAPFSHHKKYRHLHKVREEFCQDWQPKPDQSGGIYVLDGNFVKDVPSFYLTPSLKTFSKTGFSRVTSRVVRLRPCHILERTL
jgi:hypothetical protein